MPLVRDTLVIGLRKFMDTSYSDFNEEIQQSEDAAKEALANAVYEYSKDVIPTSLPAMAISAKELMITALDGMDKYNQGINVIKNAINTYALILGTGMASGGFTTVTSPLSPALPTLENIVVEKGKTSEDVANEIADIIHSWFTAWSATNPSSGTTLKWS